MKKKAGVIAASVASIVMCSSVIAGSTFALFTSDSSTNIVVKSAKLKVDAKIKSAVTYESEINSDTLEVTYGEAKAIPASGNTISLENVKPGDKFGVQLEISADASIDYKYRVSLAQSGDGELYENLLVGVDGVYYSDYVSFWENGANLGDGVVNVEIIVPAYLTNEYMEKECNLEFKVEAVQGNATVSDADSHVTHLVESAEKLVELFNGNKVAEGDTIALMAKIDEAEVTTSVKNFEIKGCDVGKITFNAPESTIDYLVNNTGTVVAEAVANESLHIYGAVTNALTVNSGRVVLMDGASVASVKMAPEADNTAKLVVANKDKATVEKVKIAGEGTSILENVELNNVEVADDSNFFAEDIESETVTVYNEKSFFAALENEKYSTIVLGNDIECSKYIFVKRSVTIDGNGHTILSSADRILRVNINDVEVNLLNTKYLHTGNAQRAIQVDSGITGVKLNIDNCTAEATYYTVNICSNAGVDLTVNNCELTGWGVINAWSSDYKIHVTNSVLKGINDKSYSAEGWNGFGTVVIEGDTTHQTELGAEALELVFENCTIIAESLNGNIQKCILFNSYSNGNNVSFVDCTFEYGKDCLLVVDNGIDNILSITGEKSNVSTVSDGEGLVAALANEKCTEIVLANDIEIVTSSSISVNRYVNLNLNKKTLTVVTTAGTAINVNSNGSFNAENGAIVVDGTYGSGTAYGCYVSGNLNFTDVEVEYKLKSERTSSRQSLYTVYISSSKTSSVFTDCKITGTLVSKVNENCNIGISGVYVSGSKAELINTELNGTTALDVAFSAEVTVKGGSLNGDTGLYSGNNSSNVVLEDVNVNGVTYGIDVHYGGNVTLKSGVVFGDATEAEIYLHENKSVFNDEESGYSWTHISTISDCTSYETVKEVYESGSVKKLVATSTYPAHTPGTPEYDEDWGTYEIKCTVCGSWVDTIYAGESEEFYYKVKDLYSLENAALNATAYIKLEKDIVVDSIKYITLLDGCVLDLNGHTITVNRTVWFNIGGNNVTIKNGKIVAKAGNSYALALYSGNVKAVDLQITGGIHVSGGCSATIENCTADANEIQYYAIWAEGNSTVTVNSGTYKAGTYGYSVRGSAGSTIVINGGTFYGTNRGGDATLTVNGGEFPDITE